MDIITGHRLCDELHAVEDDYPGWHVWKSSAGRIWAATPENHTGGSGTTLDAPTPDLMRHAIAEQVHAWQFVA